MKWVDNIACMALLCCTITSCGKKFTESTPPAPNIVYFNSFESAEDASGWHGITEQMFVDDPAPEGGKQSLYIGGGCIQPTAFITLPLQTDDGYYTLSCWGKIKESYQGGMIVLTIEGEGEEKIQLTVDNKEWSFYESQQALYCPADYKLRLEMWIGGIKSAHMFVDCIKIERLK